MAPPGSRQPAGLCDTCCHQRLVPNTRGSVFSLCERSTNEPDYPRYPRLPVLSCPGHDRRDEAPEAPEAPREEGSGR